MNGQRTMSTVQRSSTLRRSQSQISTHLQGEAVILGLTAQEFYSLDAVGARIWELLQAPTTVPALVEVLLQEYDVEPARCAGDLLAQRYGFERRWTVLFHERLVLDLWRAAPRIVFHVIHPALCSLPGVVREAPVRVLFGGEFADEVCGSGYTLPDLWAQTPLLRLLSDVRRRSREPRDVARWAKHRLAACLGRLALPFPKDLLSTDPQKGTPLDFFHRQVQEDYRAWWDRRRQEVRDDPAPWRSLAVRSTALAGFVPLNWEACSALGIRRSVPFFNREVLELAFACHPTELYGPGPKKLLRSALREDVPERNLQRPDKGRWGVDYQAAYRWRGPMPEEALPEDLEGVVGNAWLSQPPQEMDYWPLRSLTRLGIFGAALRARRQERQGRPGQKQVW